MGLKVENHSRKSKKCASKLEKWRRYGENTEGGTRYIEVVGIVLCIRADARSEQNCTPNVV
ncbi:hypothetical protein DOS79_10930 [Staphylococcus felis]|nr:hypothetical protein DOS79_10930 [Staphylococcus felis]